MNSSQIYQKIKAGILDLPGENAHLRMYPRPGAPRLKKPADSSAVESAVLLVMYELKGTVYGMLTERQEYAGKHSGQMSFPGGRMEPGDQSPRETALRETFEEIGLDSNKIEIIGKLSEVFISVSNYNVHPFIGAFDGIPEPKPNEREVKSVIHFQLADITQPDAIVRSKIRISTDVILKDVPSFIIGGKVVWGATALMLNELREILLR